MYSDQVNHHDIIEDALNGNRPVDEQVLSCLAVLEDKLEQLRKLGPQFAGVSLSPAARRLGKQATVLA